MTSQARLPQLLWLLQHTEAIERDLAVEGQDNIRDLDLVRLHIHLQEPHHGDPEHHRNLMIPLWLPFLPQQGEHRTSILGYLAISSRLNPAFPTKNPMLSFIFSPEIAMAGGYRRIINVTMSLSKPMLW